MTRPQMVKEHDRISDRISTMRKQLLRLQLQQVALQRQIASTPRQ